MKRIKGRDGLIREVDDAYVIQDGESYTIPLTMMDGRSIIHDGHGHPAGQRPGFLYSDGSERAERARVDAYAEYDKTIRERWRGQQSNQTQSEPQAFDSPEAAVAAAYAQYDETIRQRWRK